MIYLGIFIFLLNTSLGIFTMTKKKTLESFLFSSFSIGVGLWALGVYSTLITSSLFWGRTSFLGAILGIGSLFLFSFVFPGNKKISKKITLLILLPTLILILGSYSNLMIKTVSIVNNSITGTFGPAMFLYQFFAPIYILGSIFMMFKKYKKTHLNEKNKIGYVLLGISISMGVAVITNAILPLWFNIYSLNKIGPLFSIVMVSFISYAIVRHQFLDIKIIIQKGIIYTALFSFVASMYVLFVFTFEYIFNKSNDTSIFISAFITTLIGIFGVPPLERYFQKLTDRIFFKDAYDYATVLSSLTDVLNKNIALDTIIKKTSKILQGSLKSETLNFYFKHEKIIPEEDKLVIPITSHRKNIGSLVLGKKRSDDPYTKEDMNLLETFAKQAGMALEKASLYKQIKEYAETLEKKVEERTEEVVRIQKEQESMMLEISHGLQTPLTIMKGELFFLRKQGYETSRVDTIDASIDRISSFIYRFLSLSKLETSISNKKIKFDLSSTLEKVVSFFEQETESKDIRLTSSITDDIFIDGSKEEIEEMFSNLLSNSIKYMSKEGEKNIDLTLSKNDTSAIITLKDTGIGIREENIPNLFKKFYRVKSEETKGIKGTGLGLVICKKIIDMHNGTINVESEFGKGTTFTIMIPRSK